MFCGVHCVYSWPIIRIDVYLSSDSRKFGEIVFLVLMFAVCFSSFWDLISWSMLDLWVWFELHDVVWYTSFNLSLISWILVENCVCLMDLKWACWNSWKRVFYLGWRLKMMRGIISLALFLFLIFNFHWFSDFIFLTKTIWKILKKLSQIQNNFY